MLHIFFVEMNLDLLQETPCGTETITLGGTAGLPLCVLSTALGWTAGIFHSPLGSREAGVGEKHLILESLLIHSCYNGKYRRVSDWSLHRPFPSVNNKA